MCGRAHASFRRIEGRDEAILKRAGIDVAVEFRNQQHPGFVAVAAREYPVVRSEARRR